MLRSTLCVLVLGALPLLAGCGDKDGGAGNGGSGGDGGSDTGDGSDCPESEEQAWYPDDDGDGFGTPSGSLIRCEQPSGYVDNGDDCDDGDAAVFPGTEERCNGVDDNCDGSIDGDDAVDKQAFHVDADGDGFGDPEQTEIACDADDGLVENAVDCDDTDAAVHPEALERCETEGIDDDCDGEIDEADAVDATLWYEDLDGDGYGTDDSGQLGCEAPKDHAPEAADCDDNDPLVHPGAAELCNDLDDDCDPGTGEDGLVSFWDLTGNPTDLTSAWTGNAVSPAASTLSTDGSVEICAGTYYVNVDIEADVDIVGHTGDPADVVLDGAETDAVFTMGTDGIEVGVTDVTVTGGWGSADLTTTGEEYGGGLLCYGSGTGTTPELALDGVVFEDNLAYLGGAFLAIACDVEATGITVDDNAAEYVAGVGTMAGDLEISDSTITDNTAAEEVGGVYVGDLYGLGATCTLDEVEISGNEAELGSAIVVEAGATAEVSGSIATTSGVVDNTDDTDGSGVVFIGADSEIEFDTVDFGTTAGSDDNDTYDIYLGSNGFRYIYDDDQSFSCTDERCGTQSSATFGSTTTSGNTTEGARGNVSLALNHATIDQIELYVGVTAGSCDLDLYVVTSSSTTSTNWDIGYAGSATLTNTTAGWLTASDVGAPVRSGDYVGYIFEWECSGGNLSYAYDVSGSSTGDGGFSTSKGRWYQATYFGHSGTTSVNGYSADSFRYLMNVYYSH